MAIEFRIPDASCGHCKTTIEHAVTAVEGVSSADLDLGWKRLVIDHADPVDVDALRAAIANAGYTPEGAA